MKQFFAILCALLLLQACASSQSILELDSRQSMSITGKGPGQDAAINPYAGQKSVGVVKNLGTTSFSIRIQRAGVILEEITIKPSEKKEVKLLEDYELYFDSELPAKAQVRFRQYEF